MTPYLQTVHTVHCYGTYLIILLTNHNPSSWERYPFSQNLCKIILLVIKHIKSETLQCDTNFIELFGTHILQVFKRKSPYFKTCLATVSILFANVQVRVSLSLIGDKNPKSFSPPQFYIVNSPTSLFHLRVTNHGQLSHLNTSEIGIVVITMVTND